MTTQQIISLSIFGVYALGCTLACIFVFVSAMGYRDLGKGLLRILERRKKNGTLADLEGLSLEISQYYNSYAKHNPAIHKHYPCIVNWIDDVLMQNNMFNGRKHKWGSWFEEYYTLLEQVQALLEKRYPFYRCTSAQVQILLDLAALDPANGPVLQGLLRKTEDEFIHLNQEQKKNERSNRLSIAIGIAGILVSVLLTVLQTAG